MPMRLTLLTCIIGLFILQGCNNESPNSQENPTSQEHVTIAPDDTKGLMALMQSELKKGGTDDSLFLGFRFGMNEIDFDNQVTKLKSSGILIDVNDRYFGTHFFGTIFSKEDSKMPPLDFRAFGDIQNGLGTYSLGASESKKGIFSEDENSKIERITFINYFLSLFIKAYGEPQLTIPQLSINSNALNSLAVDGSAYFWFNKNKTISLYDIPNNYKLLYTDRNVQQLNASDICIASLTTKKETEKTLWGVPVPYLRRLDQRLEDFFSKELKAKVECIERSAYFSCKITNAVPYDTLSITIMDGYTTNSFSLESVSINPSSSVESAHTWNEELYKKLEALHGKPDISYSKEKMHFNAWLFKNCFIQFNYKDRAIFFTINKVTL